MTSTTHASIRAVCLLLGLAIPGWALALDSTGVYLGGNFGRARNELDSGIFDTQLTALAQQADAPITISRSAVQRLADLWSADLGWYFTDHVAAELSFIHAGQLRYFSQSTVTIGGVPTSVTSSNEVTSHGPAFSLVGRLPLTEHFEVHLRVGDYVAKTRLRQLLTVGAAPTPAQADKTASSLLAGVGCAVTLGAHWQLRADYLRLNKTGGDNTQKFSVNAVTGGIGFVF